MNEENQGNKRGDTSGQSSVQSEEKDGKHFIRNGFEIFSFDSKAVVSWGLLSVLLVFALLPFLFIKVLVPMLTKGYQIIESLIGS